MLFGQATPVWTCIHLKGDKFGPAWGCQLQLLGVTSTKTCSKTAMLQQVCIFHAAMDGWSKMCMALTKPCRRRSGCHSSTCQVAAAAAAAEAVICFHIRSSCIDWQMTWYEVAIPSFVPCSYLTDSGLAVAIACYKRTAI